MRGKYTYFRQRFSGPIPQGDGWLIEEFRDDRFVTSPSLPFYEAALEYRAQRIRQVARDGER